MYLSLSSDLNIEFLLEDSQVVLFLFVCLGKLLHNSNNAIQVRLDGWQNIANGSLD